MQLKQEYSLTGILTSFLLNYKQAQDKNSSKKIHFSANNDRPINQNEKKKVGSPELSCDIIENKQICNNIYSTKFNFYLNNKEMMLKQISENVWG